jgi:hypothetical protein
VGHDRTLPGNVGASSAAQRTPSRCTLLLRLEQRKGGSGIQARMRSTYGTWEQMRLCPGITHWSSWQKSEKTHPRSARLTDRAIASRTCRPRRARTALRRACPRRHPLGRRPLRGPTSHRRPTAGSHRTVPAWRPLGRTRKGTDRGRWSGASEGRLEQNTR